MGVPLRSYLLQDMKSTLYTKRCLLYIGCKRFSVVLPALLTEPIVLVMPFTYKQREKPLPRALCAGFLLEGGFVIFKIPAYRNGVNLYGGDKMAKKCVVICKPRYGKALEPKECKSVAEAIRYAKSKMMTYRILTPEGKQITRGY